MIISTGMRTDIPAFYAKWFDNRLRDGFVCVRNPYYKNQVTKYILNPCVVDCICFCTKNPTPIIPYLDGELSKYRQFWFVTISAYGKDYEPNVPDKTKVIEAFKQISKRVGLDAIHWRYDPIFYGNGYDRQKHIEEFTKIATALKGYTNFCVISILDLYEKVKRNAPGIYPPSKEEQIKLVKELVKIASDNGIKIRSCCEGTNLAPLGVDVSGCQTKEVIENAIGLNLKVPNAKNQRGVCGCLLGSDIGMYNTCGHLCKYCYANMDKQIVLDNIKKHNPNSPFLIGNAEKDDKITEAKQVSYISSQLSIF